MRPAAAMICLLAASATGASAQSLKDVIAKYTIAWNTPTEPFTIIGNINYVGTNGLASCLIIFAEADRRPRIALTCRRALRAC